MSKRYKHEPLCRQVLYRSRVHPAHPHYEDLLQELFLTCLKLEQTFSPEFKVKFSTYAYRRLLLEVRKFRAREARLIPTGDAVFSRTEKDGSEDAESRLDLRRALRDYPPRVQQAVADATPLSHFQGSVIDLKEARERLRSEYNR